MKSTLFAIQVLGLIVSIPTLVFLEFNHPKMKQDAAVHVQKAKATNQYPKLVDRQLAEMDLLSTSIFLLYY